MRLFFCFVFWSNFFETWIYDLKISKIMTTPLLPHPLLQALHHGTQVSQTVFLILLHLQLELLLGHAAEVAVLFHGLQEHITLVLPLLSKGPKYLCLLGLEKEERWAAEEMSQRAKIDTKTLINWIPCIDFS